MEIAARSEGLPVPETFRHRPKTFRHRTPIKFEASTERTSTRPMESKMPTANPRTGVIDSTAGMKFGDFAMPTAETSFLENHATAAANLNHFSTLGRAYTAMREGLSAKLRANVARLPEIQF